MSKFNIKDTVVAFDWGRPYRGRGCADQGEQEQSMVFIHFKGWSRKYDAWYDSKNIALKSDEEFKVLHAGSRRATGGPSAKLRAKREEREAKAAAEKQKPTRKQQRNVSAQEKRRWPGRSV